MSRKRKSFSNHFKAKVAVEALKGFKTMSELSKEYQVHPNVIGNWKKQLIERLPDVFDNKRGPRADGQGELTEQLYMQIGKLQVELDWLKKKYNSIS
jgi:transposase-like protein